MLSLLLLFSFFLTFSFHYLSPLFPCYILRFSLFFFLFSSCLLHNYILSLTFLTLLILPLFLFPLITFFLSFFLLVVSLLLYCPAQTTAIPGSKIATIWCPRGVMVKAMNCGIVVREFVLQSRFRASTLGKGMNPLILPPAMGK